MNPETSSAALALCATPLLLLLALAIHARPQEAFGYDDTPLLPDSKWRVHDGKRPQPRVVTPGAQPGAPPSDATVLFDGSDLGHWTGGDGEAKWKVENGYM